MAKMHTVCFLSLALQISQHTCKRAVTGERIVFVLALHALRLIDEQHARILKDNLR